MRRFIPLLLLCLLLWGCSAEDAPVEVTTEPPTTNPEPAQPAGTYDPFSALEEQTHGAVKVYPLHYEDIRGVCPIGEYVLLFSGGENTTTITQLSGDTLFPEVSFTINEHLRFQDFAFHGNGISYFSPAENRTVVMDVPLREIRSIDAPAELLGAPLLSPDGSILYYCTADAIRALDLESGISRVLKEASYPQQSVVQVLLDNTVLQVDITDEDGTLQSLFLSTKTGQILESAGPELVLRSSGTHYYGAICSDIYPTYVFGTPETEAQAFLPGIPDAECIFLPACSGAVTISYPEENQAVLEYYDLDSGLRQAALTIPAGSSLHSVAEEEPGIVYFLYDDPAYGCQVLCRWDTALMATNDTSVYTGTHYTRANPDHEGLAECAAYAQVLTDKYGIRILTYEDAVAVRPADYQLTSEYRADVLYRELELLDARLGNYPEGFLATLSEQFDGIRICLVSSLEGSAEAGALFWDGYTACIALAATEDTEYALYHELCHLIDSVVLTESISYDQWDTLNPADFEYDYDYGRNASRDGSLYLQEDTRSFIDTYAMSFPKEDRARIMEYAMTGGNDSLFESWAMQKKLITLCKGIRDAFGLKKSPENFLWEQYLNTPLAYTG